MALDRNTRLALGGCIAAVLLAVAMVARQIVAERAAPRLRLGPLHAMAPPREAGTPPELAAGPPPPGKH